jgi:hypothetical protein
MVRYQPAQYIKIKEIRIMSKEEVLAELDKIIQDDDVLYYKMGEVIVEDITASARNRIIKDRAGVIEALRFWLCLRDRRLTLMAVSVIGDLVITELKPDLEKLRNEIASGKTFLPYYNEWVDTALQQLRPFGI